MSPLDSKPPILRGEDGEGSVQVQMDPKVQIDTAQHFNRPGARIGLGHAFQFKHRLTHSAAPQQGSSAPRAGPESR